MLENVKMGAKIKVSDYAYCLMDKHKDAKFNEILAYSLADIDDDVSESEIKESVEEAVVKLNHLRDICIVRNDAILAMTSYAFGLNVANRYDASHIINNARIDINNCYEVAMILELRNECMNQLRSLVHKDDVERKKR